MLRDLLELRVAQGRALEPLQVEAALRRRELPFVAPVFRFAPKASAALAESVSNDALLRPCVVVEGGADAEPGASLRVEAAVESFVATPVAQDWRFVAHAPERAFAAHAELVVASLEGPALRRALGFAGTVATVRVPRSALPMPAVAQIVATTPRGPEVLAETWLGDAAAIADGRRAALEDAPVFGGDAVSGLRAALNTQRERLGLAPLRPSLDLDRVAKESLDAALASGALVHRTAAGLVADRVRAAGLHRRGTGELLARVAHGHEAAVKFFASPAHRQVLGDRALQEMGVAATRGPDGLAWIVVVLASRP